MNFIELTTLDGERFIGNINLLKRVFVTKYGKTAVVGWDNNGQSYFEVLEDYETVVSLINTRYAGVLRLSKKINLDN